MIRGPRRGPGAGRRAGLRRAAPSGGAGAAGSALALALIALAVFAGCGVGEGERMGGAATLSITGDYGDERLLAASVQGPPESETVLRFLDREAEVETRYGGGFVQSIDGLAGGSDGGRRLDWFFYVNGVESPVGAAEVEVEPGDRIWWDRHDWTDLMRVPAVVGSFPEPFLNGARGKPVGVSCLSAAERSPCERVIDALEREGVDVQTRAQGASTASGSGPGGGSGSDGHAGQAVAADRGPSVIVGPWRSVREWGDARLLEAEPARSHVFARFERRGGGWRLALLDQETSERERLGAGAGLVAAIGDGGPPTWLVAGTDAAGTDAAAAALTPAALRDRFAIAVSPDEEAIALPVAGGRP